MRKGKTNDIYYVGFLRNKIKENLRENLLLDALMIHYGFVFKVDPSLIRRRWREVSLAFTECHRR